MKRYYKVLDMKKSYWLLAIVSLMTMSGCVKSSSKIGTEINEKPQVVRTNVEETPSEEVAVNDFFSVTHTGLFLSN